MEFFDSVETDVFGRKGSTEWAWHAELTSGKAVKLVIKAKTVKLIIKTKPIQHPTTN